MVQKFLICFLVISAAVWSLSAGTDCPSVDDPNNPILFEDPDDCGAFYECAQGRAFKFNCFPGLYYNDALKRCEYLRNVNCGTRPTTPAPLTTQ